jgi:capsular exopolysaccharide synthesis family protein
MIVHKRIFAPDRTPQLVRLDSDCLELDCTEPIQMVTRPRNLVALTEQGCVAAEKFHVLAIRLRNFQKRQPLKTVLITSSIKGEGKSVISANLAVTLAQGQRTLLVDCDLHQSGLRDVLGTGVQAGIGEWWRKSTSWTNLVRKMQGLPLWYLPAGQTSEPPLEILQSERFSNMLHQFSTWFDWILLDSPPLAPVADSAALAAHVDGTLLVIRQGNTPKPLLREALKTEHLKLLGIVANEWEGSEQSYYSQYYTSYIHQHKLAANNHPQLPDAFESEA